VIWGPLLARVSPAWVALVVIVVVLLAVGWWRLSRREVVARRLMLRRLGKGWPVLAHECGLSLSGWSARAQTRREQVEVVFPFWINTWGHPFGFTARFALLPGQTVETWQAAAERLAAAWCAIRCLVRQDSPGTVTVTALQLDPLAAPVPLPAAEQPGGLLAVPLGLREDGRPWVVDLSATPHWLVVGATGSGKSTLLNALVCALATRPVALVGVDFKGGVELAPYGPRLSRLAVDRTEALPVLRALVRLVEDRRSLLRDAGARSIWDLAAQLRPIPVVLVVDEVAELFLDAGTGRAESQEIAGCSAAVLRLAQQGRALGVLWWSAASGSLATWARVSPPSGRSCRVGCACGSMTPKQHGCACRTSPLTRSTPPNALTPRGPGWRWCPTSSRAGRWLGGSPSTSNTPAPLPSRPRACKCRGSSSSPLPAPRGRAGTLPELPPDIAALLSKDLSAGRADG